MEIKCNGFKIFITFQTCNQNIFNVLLFQLFFHSRCLMKAKPEEKQLKKSDYSQMLWSLKSLNEWRNRAVV